jgi:hypothetical protein
MKYADRIEILNSKYKDILHHEMVLNVCAKQSLGAFYARTGTSFVSLTESCMKTGTLEKRQNKNFRGVPFVKNWEGITLFIDRYIDKDVIDAYGSDFNAVLVAEPESVISDTNARIDANIEKIDLILTNKDYCLKKYPQKSIWVPTAIPTIGEKFTGVNCTKKNKLISHILSAQNFAPGHKLRHKLAAEFKERYSSEIDILGSSVRRVDEKGELLERYFFSVIIENEKQENYYTEKILDCFITGTIPIYWGADIISRHFNSNGILFFNDEKDLDYIVKDIIANPVKLYKEKINEICENYRTTQNYKYLDDILLLEIIEFIVSHAKNKNVLKKLFVSNFY